MTYYDELLAPHLGSAQQWEFDLTSEPQDHASPSARDFFVSYNHNDEGWAEWIADVLEKASYSTTIQAWDILPGSNFVIEMHKAASECKKTIAVLSPDYLASMFTQAEWAVAFSVDPSGAERKLIPIRVRMCEPPGLLRPIVFCDLLGLHEERAKAAILKAVSEGRVRPGQALFPGSSLPGASPGLAGGRQIAYPGVVSEISIKPMPSAAQAAMELLTLTRTTRTTFDAQARLRDRLAHGIMGRLVLDPRVEYEELFAEYAPVLTPREVQTFEIIREFTKTVLFKYNSKMLRVLRDNPVLEKLIPGTGELRDHLTIWLAKYRTRFVKDSSVCLIYVGVNEGVPYPQNVDLELWRYLESQEGAKSVLSLEEPRAPEFNEPSSSEGNWFYDQLRRWEAREFLEAKADVARLGSSEVPEKLDIRLANILSEAIVPGSSIEKLTPVHEIIDAVARIVSVPQNIVDDNLINQARLALALSSEFLRFKSLLPLLPSLARLNTSDLSSSELKLLWQQARQDLSAWATDWYRSEIASLPTMTK